MTKFEQVGVNIQMSAIDKDDALKKFQYSCNVCCCKGMRIDCDRCAIAHTHNELIAYFNDCETSNSK